MDGLAIKAKCPTLIEGRENAAQPGDFVVLTIRCEHIHHSAALLKFRWPAPLTAFSHVRRL